MTKTPAMLTRALRAPGVWKARRVAEMAVTPRARIELERLDTFQSYLNHHLAHQADQIEGLRRAIADIEASLPAVLNAISSMNGAARLVKRELDVFRSDYDAFRSDYDTFRGDYDTFTGESEVNRNHQRAEVETLRSEIAEGDHRVLSDVRPHAETLSWLVQRVETIRFEMLNELRYGAQPDGRTALEARVVNPESLQASPLRLNIGAGHVALDGYVNVDMRELPGIDVVATVDDLPFQPESIDEIFSSHTLEHFPQEALRRQLLPYWASLLKPGGTLTTVAPDLAAMAADYDRGDMPFEDFREVLYGGQEYEGDAHFNGFTPDSFGNLLLEAGFDDVVTVASDRRNGKCKEFEITARKAS